MIENYWGGEIERKYIYFNYNGGERGRSVMFNKSE